MYNVYLLSIFLLNLSNLILLVSEFIHLVNTNQKHDNIPKDRAPKNIKNSDKYT